MLNSNSFGSLEETKKIVANTFSKQSKNIAIWGGFFSASILVWYFLSSGDFSFLLSYSSFMRCFGLGLFNYKMWSSKSAKGMSVKTLELYAIVFFTRLLSIMRHQGYLPFDKTGDWFYHLAEVMSLSAVALALYGIFGPLLPSYDEKYDKFGNLHIPNEFGAIYLLGPAVILAFIFHPSLNHEWFSDTCWTISMYVEAVAMLPQLYMFQKQAVDEGGVVETLLGHTVFALAFARIFELFFWIGSYKELAGASGYLVLFTQIAHMGIMADFFYYYFISISRGLPMELPTSRSMV